MPHVSPSADRLLAAMFAVSVVLVLLVASPFASAGCARPALQRANVLPQVSIHARLGFAPASLTVDAVASFPLSGRVVASPEAGEFDPLSVSAWADQDAPDPYGPVAISAPGSAAEPEAPSELQALTTGAVPCARIDTCQWERLRVARVLAAWGAVP